jgi:hypothetical protein
MTEVAIRTWAARGGAVLADGEPVTFLRYHTVPMCSGDCRTRALVRQVDGREVSVKTAVLRLAPRASA